MTLSTLEFVQKFGGNTLPVERQLSTLDGEVKKARILYLEGDLDSASKVMKSVMAEYPAIDERIKNVKDRALLWIHSVEWMVITSTSAIVGVALWSIMVRRKLYREPGKTRLASRS